ncbi:hypothetical protein Molly5_69 [Maribacter phage Molly_5]|uniref:Uncharacterized protein n=2 Tax=Mollyvirus TaxID=2948826 RepID=A0A8E4XVC0_9CAUD|nr:hypothetical protein M1M29_gp069 [Maribacter phage Molly_1]YP_010357316.1 hypothetical protein M1M30_gp067 [Maribacter phage Colly_1]QQO97754.1 hypothetical protein Molly2_69 [Maribacter phage Molly_2]QQO97954.1 hypothetical protein Molly3_69 [Maribacter phage Molly_3]QQO98154.1 hypothetical protein Molly4_69 [Maribacter phage Molly_4]QQO98354.1 hypothetical protein Molly5_69 [Maribacter phage Molly_5]QQO97352.1 hypothetical protein Colly1_67 [Maribacter phage Colly_1]
MENTTQETLPTTSVKSTLLKALELHAIAEDMSEQIVAKVGETKNLEELVKSSTTVLNETWNDEVFTSSIVSTVIALEENAEAYERIYPNFSTPPPATKKKAASGGSKSSTPKKPVVDLEFPIKVDLEAKSFATGKELLEACQKIVADGKSPNFQTLSEHFGVSEGRIGTLVDKTTNLTMSQFVRNEVWLDGRYE